MLTPLFAVLSTSYIAWYFENHEHAVVYPFDDTYVTPADAGASALNETIFKTTDGAQLVIWQAPPDDGQPTIVYFPGNAGTLADRATRLDDIAEAGFGVVAPAYRGSSGSSGAPDETLLVEDAAAIAESLNGPVILYGESLGAAVAIQLAARGFGDAVILEAPFTSLVDLVGVQYPMEDLSSTLTQRWESLSIVGALRQPLMVIHGEEDNVVPLEMGEMIYEAAGSPDKTFLPVGDLGHSELWTDGVRSDLFAFLMRDFAE